MGRYLLCDAIASGGMATVHLARLVGQEGFTRTVALKQLYPHFARDQDFVLMFLDEARLSSRIRHPNVVAPLDIIVLESELFIAMEYVHGEALSQITAASRTPVPPAIASAIMVQTLLGLHAAHEATGEDGQPLNIVHRDVSPQNILVGEDGVARIVDFGIAKAVSRAQTTGDGRLKGKLGYMAPEQLRFEPTDRRADIYTSGIVLWELLTGQRLFPGDNPGAVIESILSDKVLWPTLVVPGLSREMDEVTLRALAPDPNDRFQTAKDMAAALSRAVPVASTLEVGAWVESLVGPELSRRAQHIAEVERLSLADLTLARGLSPPRGAVNPAAVGAAAMNPAAVGVDPAVAAAPLLLESTSVVGAEGPAKQRSDATDLSLIPSSVNHVVPRKSRSWLVTGLALVLLGVLGALALTLHRAYIAPEAAISASTPPGEPVPSAPPPPKAGAGEDGASELSRPVERPPAPEPAKPGEPVVAAARTLNPREPAAAPPPPPPRKKPERKPDLAPSPARAAAPEPESGTSAETPTSRGKTAVSRPSCEVPYTIDARGIKRFKSECFK